MEAGEFWSIGDYSKVGDLWSQPGRDLAASLDVEGRDVVDLATGSGVTAIAMAGRGAGSVVGVDAAAKLLQEAAERSNEAGLDIDWIEADFTSVPLPDGSADLVVSTFGLIYAADPEAAFAECRRLCRPGGRIVFTSWARSGLFGQFGQTLKPYFPESPEPWHETPNSIRSVVGAEAEVAERSFPLTTETADHFVAQLERHNPVFIMGAQALGDRWPQARTELVETVAAAGAVQANGGDGVGAEGSVDGQFHADVSYLVTTINC